MSRILIPNLLLLLVVVPAAADVLTSYTFEGGGNLLYAGGVSPIAQEDGVGVSGLSMLVGGSFVVNGQPTPYGCGNIVGPHCQLKLRTGNLTGINADSWFFAGGGSIALTGGVSPVLTTPDYIIPLGSNLFSGSCLSGMPGRS